MILDERNALLSCAAKGDHDAQHALAVEAMDLAVSGEVAFQEALMCAELFARMAAERGEKREQRLLAGILFNRAALMENDGAEAHAANLLTEGIVLLNKLADDGDEDAGAMLLKLADGGFSPALFKAAANLCKKESQA